MGLVAGLPDAFFWTYSKLLGAARSSLRLSSPSAFFMILMSPLYDSGEKSRGQGAEDQRVRFPHEDVESPWTPQDR